MKKSQSSIEFVLLVGFLLFFFTLFFIAIQGRMGDQIRERRAILLRDIAMIVQGEIDLALEASDGYYREFNLPTEVDRKDYDIDITEGMVYVRVQNEQAIALPVANVTGNIVKGPNIIKKQNGEIKLNI